MSDNSNARKHEGQIVVEPLCHDDPDLAALIDAITPQNRHGEVDLGPPVGKEPL